MNEAFMKLPEDKRDRIIDICIEEFSNHGYKHTSTNVITTRAGISKGLLFHYFKNKKNLYLLIVEHVFESLFYRLLDASGEAGGDEFFDKVKHFVMLKMEIMLMHPTEYKLIMDAMQYPPRELKDELEELIALKTKELLPINEQHIFQYLDSSNLNEGIPVEKATEIIKALLFDYLGNKYSRLYEGRQEELIKNPEPMLEELDLYIDVLKNGLYKKR